MTLDGAVSDPWFYLQHSVGIKLHPKVSASLRIRARVKGSRAIVQS